MHLLQSSNIYNRLKISLVICSGLFIFMISTAAVSALTANTTVSSSIGSVISLLTTNGTVNADVVPSSGGAQTISSDTITVSTNDTSGYTLTLAETGASSALASGGNTIPASAGSQGTPVTMSVNTWGYAVQNIGGFNTSGYASANSTAINGTLKFAAVPATGSPNTLKSTSGTATNDTTTVWYGVAVNTSQPFGTYTNSVTYTATTN